MKMVMKYPAKITFTPFCSPLGGLLVTTADASSLCLCDRGVSWLML
jgi:hypothetical protein